MGGVCLSALIFSATALTVMEEVKALCKTPCHPFVPNSINVSKGVFVASGLGLMTVGWVALYNKPK
ncbi:hypothetical protein AM10699_57020 (plasmid) [Acaryochloris marina MBIC10699]|nr:hypothetical protein AM10699_57020 [Acaryochloris marina MBIC10699]